jgi:hypothetical protein
MSSAGILEVAVSEKTELAPALRKLEIPARGPASAPQEEKGQLRMLLVGGFILGAIMLGAMGGTLLIWAYLR